MKTVKYFKSIERVQEEVDAHHAEFRSNGMTRLHLNSHNPLHQLHPVHAMSPPPTIPYVLKNGFLNGEEMRPGWNWDDVVSGKR